MLALAFFGAAMPRPSDPNAHAKLLAAAAEVFAARGLEAAKVEDIAAGAGLSKGSFYLHFDSKDHAFRVLVEAMLGQLKSRCEARPEDFGFARGETLDDFLDRTVRHDVEVFDFLWTNRALVGLLLNGGQCSAYHHLVECFYDDVADKTRRLLGQGIAVGMYRADLDVEIATAFISGAYDRLARKIVREPERPDFRQMLHDTQRLVLRGVGSRATVARLEALPVTPKRAPSQRPRPARPKPPRHTPRSTLNPEKAVKAVPKARKRAPR